VRTRYCISILIFICLSKAFAGDVVPSDVKTKKIIYRGGVAEFLLPEKWREEYDAKGGGTFYEDRKDSGTLRLNVLSFDSKNTPANEMALAAFPKASYEVMESGLPIRHYDESSIENGEKLKIYYWEIAIPVPPNSIRLAIFSHTVLDSPSTATNTQSELAFLNHSIRQASFSRDAGVGP